MYITEKKFNQLRYIGEGTEGVVRKYNDEIALKKMYYEEFDDNKKKSINAQCKIEDSNFIFPIDILYIDRKYRGYTQKIIHGKQPAISDLNNLKSFVLMVKELESSLCYLTSHHLIIRDLEPRNSIFFQNKLYIIDTSRYLLSEDVPNIFIERENKRLLNYFLINTIINDTELSIFDLSIIMKKLSLKIQSLYGSIYEDVNFYFDSPNDFSKFMKTLMNELKIEKLEELHEKILKLR